MSQHSDQLAPTYCNRRRLNALKRNADGFWRDSHSAFKNVDNNFDKFQSGERRQNERELATDRRLTQRVVSLEQLVALRDEFAVFATFRGKDLEFELPLFTTTQNSELSKTVNRLKNQRGHMIVGAFSGLVFLASLGVELATSTGFFDLTSLGVLNLALTLILAGLVGKLFSICYLKFRLRRYLSAAVKRYGWQ